MSLLLKPISPQRVFRLFLVSAILIITFITSSTPAHAAFRLNTPIRNGNVIVDYMGHPATPTSRIQWLVQIADRSSCTIDPIHVNCDGFMSTGDRVIVGDGYMAFMDLTRTVGTYDGGGGTLRGLWMLNSDAAGNKNFRYISNGNNHAPNNLYPYQVMGGGGAAHELIVVPAGGEEFRDSFRAVSSASVMPVIDGFYNSTPGSEHFYYHFQGIMTQGCAPPGVACAPGTPRRDYNTNIGTTIQPAQLNYHIQYWFLNNYYTANSPNNAFTIQVRASVDVQGGSGWYQTQSLDTFVFDLGFANINGDSKVRLDHLKPVSHDLTSGGCLGSTSIGRGQYYNLTANCKYNYYVYAINPFQVKIKADDGQSTLNNFRFGIRESVLLTSGFTTNWPKHDIIYDHDTSGQALDLKVIVYDVKLNGVGIMPPSAWIQSDYFMSFEFETP